MCGSIQDSSRDGDGAAADYDDAQTMNDQQEVSSPLTPSSPAAAAAAVADAIIDDTINDRRSIVSFANIQIREYFYCLGE